MTAFRQVALAAWALSVQSGRLSLRDASEADLACRGENFNPGIAQEWIQAYPEIAAEVTGYGRSHARRNGLHLMIDVGAGTLDVSTFLMHADEESDLVSFLCAAVARLGTCSLRDFRAEQLCAAITKRARGADMSLPLEESVDYLLKLTAKEKSDIDNRFGDLCREIWRKLLLATKEERAPRESQFIDMEELPIFLCGGGSQSRST